MKKYMLIFVVLMFVMTTLYPSSSEVIPKSDISYATYNDIKGRYQIKHPSSWIATPIENSPIDQVIFQADEGESLSIEYYEYPSSLKGKTITSSTMLEYADMLMAGLTDGAKKNNIEIAIEQEPALYKTTKHEWVKMAGMLHGENVGLFGFMFTDIYIIQSKTGMLVLSFMSWSKVFGNEIENVIELFRLKSN